MSDLSVTSAHVDASVEVPSGLMEAEAAERIPESTGPRLFYLDHLRVFLTVLVILHHAAVTYGNLPIWYYSEPAKDPSGAVLDRFLLVNQAFFMGFFFLISGYFVPRSYDRKGGRRFMRDRLVRLGIPLLVFLLVLRPILIAGLYPTIRAMAAEKGAELPYWVFYLITWDPGPLWFVELLLVFSWVYARFRRFREKRTTFERSAATAGAWVPGIESLVGLALGLTGLTYLWRCLVPFGQYWPIVGLPTPGCLPQYVSLFVIGVLAYRRGWLQSLPASAGWFGLAMATVATAVLYPVTVGPAFQGDAWTGHGTRESLLYALWESCFAVGVIAALLVFFRDRLNGDGRFVRFLSEHAYAVYIIHPLVLVALGYALSWLNAFAVVKFAILAALAVPLCWLAAAAVRAIPQVRRIV